MIDFDKWQEIFTSMHRHKLRTFLTALSVWWGIFMLVILLGAGRGLQNSVEHNFKDDATNSLWIYRGRTSQPYKGLPPGRRVQFTNDDYYKLINDVPAIEHATGRFHINGEFVIKYKNTPLSFRVRCVNPGHRYTENTLITKGRYINDKDIEDYRKVCVIGKLVAEGFFKDKTEPIGQYINIKGIDYKIVGVFKDVGSDNEMRMIYLPITTAQRVYNGQKNVHQMIFTVGDATVEESGVLEEKIRKILAEQHKFSPQDDQAIYVSNNVENFAEFQMVFTFIRGFIWFVGIGSIIAGVIGVSNIMLIIVKDRTKEIGIRKALGATPWSIISMIVQESIFLTSIAGYVGLLTGVGLIYGVRNFMESNQIESEFFRNPEVDFNVVFMALFILIISGAVSGLIPALQAVKVNPVIAMKS